MQEALQMINVLEAVISLISLNQVHSHQHSMIQTYDPESKLLSKKPYGECTHTVCFFQFYGDILGRKMTEALSIPSSTLISKSSCFPVEGNKGELNISQLIGFCQFSLLFFGTFYSSLLLDYRANYFSLARYTQATDWKALM